MSHPTFSSAVTWPPAGRYILAVSGGVDSVVLLDLMASTAEQRDYELVVAHVNHGLRPDAATDQALVRGLAEQYGLPFVTTDLTLANTSEAAARHGRYQFLDQVRVREQADAMITAHTLDDQLETVVFAALRTVGGRGLSGIASGGQLLRPLLAVPKAAILKHAQDHGLQWREDSTNADLGYARNAIRQLVVPQIERSDSSVSQELLEAADTLRVARAELAQAAQDWIGAHTSQADGALELSRAEVSRLELPVLAALLSEAAHLHFPACELTSDRVWEAARFALVARRGQVELGSGLTLSVTKTAIVLSIAPPLSNR